MSNRDAEAYLALCSELTSLMDERGVDSVRLAKVSGVQVGAIRAMRGGQPVTLPALQQIARAMGADLRIGLRHSAWPGVRRQKGEGISPCLDCGRKMRSARASEELYPGTVVHHARGLCYRCFSLHRRAGTLEVFSRTSRSREDVLRAALKCRVFDQTTIRGAAESIGITHSNLSRHLENARKAGDWRGWMFSLPPGEVLARMQDSTGE